MNIFVAHSSDLLTDHRPHGDGLVAYGFIRSLAERGHIVHVATQYADIKGPLPPNVKLYHIDLKRKNAVQQRLEYMVRVRKLLKTIRREHPIDLIHQLNPVFTGISLSLVGTGLPLVLGPYVGSWPKAMLDHDGNRTLHKSVFSNAVTALAFVQQMFADALLITTPDALSRIPAAKTKASRIHVLPHGIDPSLFAPVPEWTSHEAMAKDQANPSILFFAHVWRGKGLDVLLDAFDQIAAAVPNVTLRVAGAGKDLDAMKEKASTLAFASQIEWLGARTRDEAEALFQNTSVYCLPSRGEPFGMTALEAMSCGKPLVVTKAGGLGFLVQEQGGRTVRVDDPKALAAALIELLSNPELRASMGRFNRARVQTEFRWEVLAEKLELIYWQILRSAPSMQPEKLPSPGKTILHSYGTGKAPALRQHKQHKGPPRCGGPLCCPAAVTALQAGRCTRWWLQER